VIPVLDDAAALGQLLADVRAAFGASLCDVERIVVDGGSRDASVDVARANGAGTLVADRGRARQLIAGIAAARSDWIWMLHADSRIDASAADALQRVIADREPAWGRFDIGLSGRHPLLRVVEALMNARSRITGIATGDQGVFAHRALLERIGGVPDQPLMEDIELSKRLRRIARPRCLAAQIETSSRRWEARGIVRTVALMWRLRAMYAFGASPERLERIYYRG